MLEKREETSFIYLKKGSCRGLPRVDHVAGRTGLEIWLFSDINFYPSLKRLSKMSKSRRVFLSIQGDDDFWGNGDQLEGKTLSSIKQQESKKMDDSVEGMEEEKYFFRQSKLGRQNLERLHEKEEQECEEERLDWSEKVDSEEEEEDIQEQDEIITEGKETEMFDSGPETDQKMPVDPNEGFYNNYRSYFSGRPEMLFLIRSIDESATDYYEKPFIDLYETTRKRLEMYPNTELNQILRCACNPNAGGGADYRVRNKHAVVVSNFREPDRRLGRYSKYYYHHNVGPEVYSRKVFVGGLPACVKEMDILHFFSRYGRLQVDWPSKHYGCKSDSDPSVYNEPSFTPPTSHLGLSSPPFGQINPFMTDCPPAPSDLQMSRHGSVDGGGGGFPTHGMSMRNIGFGGGSGPRSTGEGEKKQQHLGYVFLLFEKERSVRDLVTECFEEEEGLFIILESAIEPIRVQIRPWLLADAEFLMDFNVPINTKMVAFIGGVPRPLKAVELAHFFEQTYGNVVCVGIDIDNKFKYPRGSGRVAFSNYHAYVQAITDRYIVLDHEDIHKRVEIKPYFFHNQSCEECSSRYHRQYAPFFCPSLECFQYYCEPCWHKMHARPSRFHHMPVVKGI
ncbi:hypothetical protein L3Y34_018462 [Caenorhabditis briggsae]|nr:hypothetical protein L3Y34_018462 [Caenorhabditis briggsae]